MLAWDGVRFAGAWPEHEWLYVEFGLLWYFDAVLDFRCELVLISQLFLEILYGADCKFIEKHSTFDALFHAVCVNANAEYVPLVVVKNRTATHSLLCLEIVTDCLELSALYASAYRAYLSFRSFSLHADIEKVGFC